MHLYIELWKTRPAWHALSVAERESYVAQLGPAIGQLLANGVELLGFALADAEAPYDAGYTYLAAWRMPDLERARALEAAVDGAGWHRYFEQVNARGAIVSPSEVLAHMARGSQPAAGGHATGDA
jgi:hypothetical protein